MTPRHMLLTEITSGIVTVHYRNSNCFQYQNTIRDNAKLTST